MINRIKFDDRKTPAYLEGREARKRYEPNTACPHPCGGTEGKRQDWLVGWLDERYSHITGL